MSAAERGVEFLWERSTKKLEEAQKQGQEQDGSQQQPHAPVQVAGNPGKRGSLTASGKETAYP